MAELPEHNEDSIPGPASTFSIETRDEDELRAIVQQLDPQLTFILDLHPTASKSRTLLVWEGEQQCTLKIRKLTHNIWDEMYFYYEIHALHRVAERNIQGVTRLIREYRDEQFHAILKSFADGTPCNTLDTDELLTNREFIAKLDALYLKLHLAGIAKINFLPRKLVIGDDGALTLVDLSTCIVNTESGIQVFVQEMKDDSRFITKLEKKATH